MQLKPMRVGSIHLYSKGLSKEDWLLTGVNKVTDLEACIRDIMAESGDPAIAVIPEGPYVVPIYRST